MKQVCSEESLQVIQERYIKHNKHAASYTWKYIGSILDMTKTLEENNIIDESVEFNKLSMDEFSDACIAEVHVYYNDDLTIN